jgi:hypothetical protein
VSDPVATGRFQTAWEIRDGVAQQYRASYTLGGVYSLLQRLKCAPLVPFTPRPTQRCRQPGKRGLKQALAAARVSQATALGFADEMRVGLRVKVHPRLQLADPWRYRFLVVNAQAGQLHWCWLASMAGAPMGRQWVD